MPTGGFGRAIIAAAVLLAGCVGGAGPTPSGSGAPSASGTPSVTGSAASRPPLAGDLTGGVPLRLGGAGHWAIADGRALVAADDGTVTAIELATGRTVWRASFTLGKPWDAQPTLALSADRSTVVALRTVDAEGASHLGLLLLDAASGATVAERLIADPERQWRVDLPPRVLAADADTIVLAADPESGRQTAVVRVADGTIAWQTDDQAVAATGDTVVTRGAGWERSTGAKRWQATVPLGPLLALAPAVLVVQRASVAVWLDPATGLEWSRTERLGEAEPPCAATADALVCLGEGVTGYDLADGKYLWKAPQPADAIAVVDGWVYLWRAAGRGDVLDARTGRVLIADAALPSVRYADRTGVLITGDTGYTWVPFPR